MSNTPVPGPPPGRAAATAAASSQRKSLADAAQARRPQQPTATPTPPETERLLADIEATSADRYIAIEDRQAELRDELARLDAEEHMLGQLFDEAQDNANDPDKLSEILAELRQKRPRSATRSSWTARSPKAPRVPKSSQGKKGPGTNVGLAILNRLAPPKN